MFNSYKLKTRNYIRYLCLAIGLVISSNADCGTLKQFFVKNFASKKILTPWKDTYGYIPGGKLFDGIIENESGRKYVITDKQAEKHTLVDPLGRKHIVNHSRSGDYFITDEKGKKYPVHDMGDNVVIVIFSTSWCPNCPGVVKKLAQLQKHFKSLNINNVKVVYLNVGYESITEVKNHLQNIGAKLDVYQSVPSHYMNDLRGVPSVLVFDRNGQNICGYIGAGYDYMSDEFVKFIIKLAR